MAQRRERGIYTFATPRDGRITLQWHFKNEVEHYGCLDLRPCYDSRPFRISRWLESDNPLYKKAESTRYCEWDEFGFGTWKARMQPWERKSELITELPEFHTLKENKRYLDHALYWAFGEGTKCDSIQVVYPPYSGHPLVCAIKDDKVTIY